MKEKWVLRHCDLDLWPNSKVTNFSRLWASVVSNHLAKTASKRLEFLFTSIQTHTHTRTHTHTQTNCSENITPPRFRGGIKIHREFETEYFLQYRIWSSTNTKIDTETDMALYMQTMFDNVITQSAFMIGL